MGDSRVTNTQNQLALEEIVSPLSYRLFHYLRGRPEGDNIPMEELVLTLHSSKTAIRAALVELEAEGLISTTQES